MAGEERFQWLLEIVPSLDLNAFKGQLATLESELKKISQGGGSPANAATASTNATQNVQDQGQALYQKTLETAAKASSDGYIKLAAQSISTSAALTRAQAADEAYVGARVQAATANAEMQAALSQAQAADRGYIAARVQAAAASAEESAAIAQASSVNEEYISAKVAVAKANLAESGAIQQALAADQEYITATAEAANRRRAAAAQERSAQLSGVGLGGAAEQQLAGYSLNSAGRTVDARGQFVSQQNVAALQAEADANREAVLHAEASNKVAQSYQQAQAGLLEATLRQESIKARIAAGEETELDLLSQRRVIDNELNAALRSQVAAAEKAAYQSSIANGGPNGSLFQRLNATVKSGQSGNFENPNDQATLGQFLGNKALTTAGFAASGIALYGGFTQISQGIKNAEQFEAALVPVRQQLLAIGKGDQFGGLKSSLEDISASTGQKAQDLADIAQRFVATFKDARQAAEEVKSIAQLTVVSGADISTVAQAAQAATNNFGISARQLGDIAIQQRNAFGTPTSETLQFFGSVSPVASNFGFSAREAATVAGGLTSQAPSRTGAAEAESLNRFLPDLYKNAQKLVDFQNGLGGKKLFDTNSLVSGDLGTAFQQILANFDKLTPAEQKQFEALSTSSRNQKDLIAVLDARHQITNTLNNSLTTQGSLETEFAARQDTLKQKVADLGAGFRKFVQDLYDSGLGDLLKLFVDGFSSIVGFGTSVISVFSTLAGYLGPVKDVLLAAGAFLALRSAATFIGGFAGELAGTSGVTGAAARAAGIKPTDATAGATLEASATESGSIFTSAAESVGAIWTAAAERVAALFTSSATESAGATAAGGTEAGAAMATGGATAEAELAAGGAAGGVGGEVGGLAGGAEGLGGAGLLAGEGAGAGVLATAGAAVAPVAIGALIGSLISKKLKSQFEFFGGNKFNAGQFDSSLAGQTANDVQKQIDDLSKAQGVSDPLNNAQKGLGDSALFHVGGLNFVHTGFASTDQKKLVELVKVQKQNITDADNAVVKDLIDAGLITQSTVDYLRKQSADAGGDPYQQAEDALHGALGPVVPGKETPAQKQAAIDLKARLAGQAPKNLAGADDIAAQQIVDPIHESTQNAISAFQSGDRTFAQTKAAVDEQIQALKQEYANNPSDVLGKEITADQKAIRDALFTNIETQISTLQDSFNSGDVSEGQYETKIRGFISQLQTQGGAPGAKKAADLLKQLNTQKSNNIVAYVQNQASLIDLLGGKGGDAQDDKLNLYLGQLNNPALDNKDRTTVVTSALQAEKQKFADQVSGLTTDEAKLAALKKGFEIPASLTQALLSNQLSDVLGPYRDSIGKISDDLGLTATVFSNEVAALATSQGVNAQQAAIEIARGKLVADQAVLLAAEKAALAIEFANGPTQGGNNAALQAARGAIGAAQSKVAQDNAALQDALKSGDLAGALPQTKLEGDAQQEGALNKSKTDQTRTLLKAKLAAQIAFFKAVFANDPIALAQADLQAANEAMADAQAEAPGLQRDADILNARAQQVTAQRGISQAIAALAQSQIGLLKAYADAAGDTVASANLNLQLVYAQLLERVKEDGAAAGQDPQVNALKGQVLTAQRQVYDATLQKKESTIDFNLSVKNISTAQAIAQYQALLSSADALHLTQTEQQDLQKKIFDLKQTLTQNLQFDLPSDLRLPTLYEARRLSQSGGNYQDNRNITITVSTNAKLSPKDTVNQITDAINSPPRFGTRTRTY